MPLLSLLRRKNTVELEYIRGVLKVGVKVLSLTHVSEGY